jgi:hypothetical protein
MLAALSSIDASLLLDLVYLLASLFLAFGEVFLHKLIAVLTNLQLRADQGERTLHKPILTLCLLVLVVPRAEDVIFALARKLQWEEGICLYRLFQLPCILLYDWEARIDL